MQWGMIVGLLFGLVIAFFAVLNTEIVMLKYYFGQMEITVALLVLAAATLGALSVGLLGLITQVRSGFAIWDFRNKVKRLSGEVEALKNQKRVLIDDLSFVNAECEQVLREKEVQLEEYQHSHHADNIEEPEEKETDGLL